MNLKKSCRRVVLAVSLLMLSGGAARAGREAEDLKRQIDSQRAAVADLERVDDHHLVTDEITLLRTWLDEAGAQHAKEQWDRVREVLDRCVAEAELIRQRVTAMRLASQVQAREAALKASRERLARTKEALQQAITTKKAMEMNAK